MLLAVGCFISRRRAQLAAERHMDERYLAYELAAAGEMVRQPISHGANVNTADAYGRTPLMMAAMQNWPEAVRALLDAHASVGARDHAGHTVLDFVDPEERQLVRILTAAGAPPPSRHSARLVCDAERAMDKLGYHMPITDCIDGRQFAGGLRKFQEEHALKATDERLGIRP
jgi:ankyrin repeat protein